jgi:nitroreductase
MNGEKIPQDKLERILKATKLAPSSYGLTPYNVIVVEDQKLKEELQGDETILIKGSRAQHMENVAAALVENFRN